MKVSIAVIQHRHGIDCKVASTKERLDKLLADWAGMWSHELADTDADTVTRHLDAGEYSQAWTTYFEKHPSESADVFYDVDVSDATQDS